MSKLQGEIGDSCRLHCELSERYLRLIYASLSEMYEHFLFGRWTAIGRNVRYPVPRLLHRNKDFVIIVYVE